MFKKTLAVDKILQCKKRLRIIQGGSSAGKTIAILLILINEAQTNKKTISVVAETMPHLRRGAMRDFLNIMKDHNYFKDERWNATNSIYEFETGSVLEFFSTDSPDRVRGQRRDILFINEANNITLDSFTQLEIRTREYVYIDYNPVAEFWVHTDIIPHLEHDFLILTYQDNDALDQSIVQSIESRKDNKYFWNVYGLGLLGEVEGKIYNNWEFIDSIPQEARLERMGLDFGYTNDPSALVAVYRWDNSWVIDERFYTKGLSNKQISDLLSLEPRALVIADSAEPKSIDELKSYGHLIVGSQKGKGSVLQGIQYVQDQHILVTKQSTNIIKEYRNYMWLTDKDGKKINEPSGIWDHSMSAIRYALDSFRQTRKWTPSYVGGVQPLIPGTLA